ncbi:hypothetical protein GGS21DRAFT_54844 [Xylaria nigripes]|nr:hypothetical protein GGS21DRAFT_54844 [Xylaria nigripes]
MTTCRGSCVGIFVSLFKRTPCKCTCGSPFGTSESPRLSCFISASMTQLLLATYRELRDLVSHPHKHRAPRKQPLNSGEEIPSNGGIYVFTILYYCNILRSNEVGVNLRDRNVFPAHAFVSPPFFSRMVFFFFFLIVYLTYLSFSLLPRYASSTRESVRGECGCCNSPSLPVPPLSLSSGTIVYPMSLLFLFDFPTYPRRHTYLQ